MGYSKPKHFIPGMELSGIIESVGRNVDMLKAGDSVFGSSGMRMGANAEYKCRSVKGGLAIKPAGLSFEDAATIPVGGINALHFLRKANIRPEQKILVIGAGGAIGTYGVQLAKLYGAEVTAVDTSSKLEMLRSIGADHVIDYTEGDYFQNPIKYDVVFDMVYGSPYSKCINALAERGVYLMANPGPARMIRSLWMPRKNNKEVIFQFASETVEDLNYLADLVISKKIKPVIDKIYPLEKTAEAHAYVEHGHKKGCVVIKC
jgi:NADPH:quinone reductase-like Zn-dependent oxidoreductase